ncbi:MAG: tetratricopeptide repeat protein [Bacteroidales bacterium]|nr:tetratricopeptide repeat protein [Bacteroidales bacterium]
MKYQILTLIALLIIYLGSCMPREQKAQELLREGSEKVAQSQHEEAIKLFSKAIMLMPEFAVAYSYRGSAKFDLGDLNGAHEDYTKAIEIDPTYAEPYDFRGRIKQLWYDEAGACEDFLKAAALGRPNMSEKVRRCE